MQVLTKGIRIIATFLSASGKDHHSFFSTKGNAT